RRNRLNTQLSSHPRQVLGPGGYSRRRQIGRPDAAAATGSAARNPGSGALARPRRPPVDLR
ncbi:MAG: hypothetical protein QOC75_3594, partial [Pseudonocardiales bacterium]|nr:hypothetical protein [Pseudonocardiales bacterium]